MPILEVDCTTSALPRGVRVARCRRFDGWSLEATRSFAPGEVVYRYPLRLIDADTEVHLLTELGVRRCNPEDHFLPLEPGLLAAVPPAMRERMAGFLGAASDDPDELHRLISDGGEPRWLMLGFDELLNHAAAPNCRVSLAPVELDLEGDEPVAWGELFALHAIHPGDELTVDYRTFCGPDWQVPAHWCA